MKRYIYIIIGIVIVAAVAILFIFLFRSNSAAPGAPAGTTGSLPSVGAQGSNGGAGNSASGTDGSSSGGVTGTDNGGAEAPLVKSFGILSTDPVLDYFVDAQNNVLEVEPDGEIAEITGGQSTKLSGSAIDSVASADFSYSGEKILLSFGSAQNPQLSVFDVASRTWAGLPQGLSSPRWSPSDSRIAYIKNVSTGTIAIATIDASNLKKAPVTIMTLNAQGLSLRWLNKNQLVLFDAPSSFSDGSVWLVDMQKRTLVPVLQEIAGLESTWSSGTASSGPLGLVFVTGASGRGGKLSLNSLAGKPTQNLTVATLPSKCLFNTEEMTPDASSTDATSTKPTPYLALYCGVPRDQNKLAFSRLPDDYEEMALFTSDDIYKINLLTGNISAVWNDATQNMDVSALTFANGRLFFINRYDQKLYALSF